MVEESVRKRREEGMGRGMEDVLAWNVRAGSKVSCERRFTREGLGFAVGARERFRTRVDALMAG